ncbi:MAG: hypothetical protein ACK4TC_06320 [Sphingomonas pseudosanguinis]|uniref:hypothetical protein n=1 Tax=Sphingomonas pseudosanguinis TaxID=413712 RepID=UPI00391B7E9C
MDPNAGGKAATKNTPSNTDQPQSEVEAGVTAYQVAPGRTVGGKGPGESVDLNDTDALRFFELGFILDEDGNRVGFTGGPKTVAGIEIKEI